MSLTCTYIRKYTFSSPREVKELANKKFCYDLLFIDNAYGSKLEVRLQDSTGKVFSEDYSLFLDEYDAAEVWVKGEATGGEWEELSDCWETFEARGRLVAYAEERKKRV